jgi:hypothetical protein
VHRVSWLRRFLRSSLVAAGVGFVMFSVCAALIKADMRRGGGMFNNLGATIIF